MQRVIVALVGACSVIGACRVAFADEARLDVEPPTVAIETYVDPVLAVRTPELDPSRYETYIREFVRATVPRAKIIAEAPGERAASHVLAMDFSPGEAAGEVRVTLNVKVGRGLARRMDLGKSASARVVASDTAAIERFLRQHVQRIVGLYRLGGGPFATTESGTDATSRIELGVAIIFDPKARTPAPDAVSGVIRTTLTTELPNVILIGPVDPADRGADRAVLRIETWTGRLRVVLTDPARGELFRAEGTFEDGDGARALRFLREAVRAAALKFSEPALVPIVGAGSATPRPPDGPIEREWGPSGQESGGPATAAAPLSPVAPLTARLQTHDEQSLPTSRWVVRGITGGVVGLGLAGLGVGVWAGLDAKDAAADFHRAGTQLDANRAKHRSEERAQLANRMFLAGTGALILGGTSIALDAFGVYDRWFGRPSRAGRVQVLPTDRGVVGVWSLPLP